MNGTDNVLATVDLRSVIIGFSPFGQLLKAKGVPGCVRNCVKTCNKVSVDRSYAVDVNVSPSCELKSSLWSIRVQLPHSERRPVRVAGES